MKKSTKTVSFDEKKEKVDRIREKIAELGEKRAATEEKWKNADPMEKVALERTMQQESDTMILLERELAETEKAIVDNLLPPNDDRDQFFGGIQKCINEGMEKITAVKEKYIAIKELVKKADEDLKSATQAADLLAMGKAKQAKEDAEKALVYADQMVKDAEAYKTFPEGFIIEEWKKGCENRRAEWEADLSDVLLFANAYRLAVKKFLLLHDDMMNIRREMGQFSIDLDGVSVNFPVILTQNRSTFDQKAYMNSLQITQKEGAEIGRAFKWGQII